MAKKALHWADQTAQRIIAVMGDKEQYTVAAGITPSGTIHIGNFREIVTADLIRIALESLGKKVRFIYSWDDYDVFRKVPMNMPKQDLLKSYLRKPITEVPDTFDCNHKSYARHNEMMVEETLPDVGINPEYIYQTKQYNNCVYAEEIKTALENTNKIKELIDEHRKEPHPADWLPIEIFCEKCGTDNITKKEYKGGYNVYYECECGHKEEIDFRKKGIVKLKWRIDWPMRWHYEKVDFESAGKDHFAAGGSRETGENILKEVWGEKLTGFMYEWIRIKGGIQFSSSKGVATTLNDVLEIYEAEIVRYLFAGSRPATEFAISFDLDVVKIYEDFDKLERIYFKEQKVSEKEYEKQKRVYELSCIKVPKKLPFQPSFRHLTNVVQINGMDVDKSISYYEKQLKDKFDKERLRVRAECAKNWIEKYAPEDFKFKINEEVSAKLNEKEKEVIAKIAKALGRDLGDKELHEEFYVIAESAGINHVELFKAAYKVLISKERGPKLASFILAIGRDKVKKLFEKV